MNLLVVGTVAYDTVKTPFGERSRVLGGSASFFSAAASYFTSVAVLAVVGEDFAAKDRKVLEDRGVDLSALTVLPGEKSFHWKGEYGDDLNDARTLATDLNALSRFDPVVPSHLREVPYLFLANIDPVMRARVLDQVSGPKVVAADTMNYWIANRRQELLDLLPRIQILVINEAEARQLAGEQNLVRAGRKLLSWGPKMLILKRGEYGVLEVAADGLFAAPAFPLETVMDPTGAGDTFAAGFMGSLAAAGEFSPKAVRNAIVMGSVMASFDVEAFSLDRLAALGREEIEGRYQAFRKLTEFAGS